MRQKWSTGVFYSTFQKIESDLWFETWPEMNNFFLVLLSTSVIFGVSRRMCKGLCCISDIQGCVPGYERSSWEFPLYYAVEKLGGSIAKDCSLKANCMHWLGWERRAASHNGSTTAHHLQGEAGCTVWAGRLTCWLVLLMGAIMQ